MEFFDKLYVGFQKGRYNQTDNQRMLGFAAPDTGDFASKKRKETVDGWRDKNIPILNLENKPRYGFQIVDTVSRYSTSNKLFRVLDPAGFELEVSAENLFRIIGECAIIKGTISDPMVWGRDGGKNVLVSANSEEYKMHLQPKVSAKLIPGAWMKHKTGNVYYRYEGEFPYLKLSLTANRYAPKQRSYWYNNSPDYLKVETTLTYIVDKTANKPATVYTEWVLNNDGNFKKKPSMFHIRKSKLKDLIDLDESDPKTVDYQLPLDKAIDQIYVASQLVTWSERIVLFGTKEEMLSKKYEESEFELLFEKSNYNRPDNYYGTIISIFKELKP